MSLILWLVLAGVILIWLGTLGETLAWWYIWAKQSRQSVPRQNSWRRAIIFLTGVSDYAVEMLQPEQIDLLGSLGRHYAADLILAEPFPYERMTAQKFARFDLWRRLGLKELPVWVWSLHNFWQTLLVIYFERAYGAALARCLVNRIGLPPAESNNTLLFICGSAGAALALAAAPYLKERLPARIVMIAYGGVFGSARGFEAVDTCCQLVGENDGWARLAGAAFPGRWLIGGPCARARAENRFRVYPIGPHAHFGPKGYLGQVFLESEGKNYRDLTLKAIMALQVWEESGFRPNTFQITLSRASRSGTRFASDAE